MSRPRSGSPRHRSFSWDESDFDPNKVLEDLDVSPVDRSRHSREFPKESRNFFRGDMFLEGQRRSPPFPHGHQSGQRHHLDQEGFGRRRPSPHNSVMHFGDRRFSPEREGGFDGDRFRRGFREDFQRFENRGRSPHSPLRLPGERSRPMPKSHLEHSQRSPGMGWRKEEQVRGRGRFRELSPGVRLDEQREGPGRERGRRNAQGPSRDQQRDDLHQERNPPLKRQRREMDDPSQLGFSRNEKDFGEQRFSVGSARAGFEGDAHGGRQGDFQRRGPVVIDHHHGVADSREAPRREQFDDRGYRNPDFDRQRTLRPGRSSQERFRMSNSRSDAQEDMRGHNFKDDWRDSSYQGTRRSPLPQDGPNIMRYGHRDGCTNPRGRSSFRPVRGRFSHNQDGKTGPPKKVPGLGYQDRPQEQPRPSYRTQRADSYEGAKEEPPWAEEGLQEWEGDRPGSPERRPPRNDVDPKVSRERERRWNNQKSNNMTVVTEETLTIKVDMSRPVNQKSPQCYTSDRQLSLDLVNVGRQRLDFLPMLEHSGTYRETAVHTGTFAQEIITLVHLVKELYFKGDGVTLNERFSAPKKGNFPEEETEELTLNQRFSSSRGFSLNLNLPLDGDTPLFSRLGSVQGLSQQPTRGPGDLRHDLERRRLERLEGVKVTIPGHSQRPLGPASEQSSEFSDTDELAQMEDDGFSWKEEPTRRWEGAAGPRRGASYRLNTGPQRGNTRNRLGPMRRQNDHSNPAGPNW